MKLTKLELSGFKSFADTVELTFESGVTAIVGPFATREQADSASRSLGMPSFVISGPGTPAP